MDYHTNTYHIHTFCNFFSLNSAFFLCISRSTLRYTAFFLTATKYVTILFIDLNMTWPFSMPSPEAPLTLNTYCVRSDDSIIDCITAQRASCKSVPLRNYRQFTNNQSLWGLFLCKSLPSGLSPPFRSYHVPLLEDPVTGDYSLLPAQAAQCHICPCSCGFLAKPAPSWPSKNSPHISGPDDNR